MRSFGTIVVVLGAMLSACGGPIDDGASQGTPAETPVGAQWVSISDNAMELRTSEGATLVAKCTSDDGDTCTCKGTCIADKYGCSCL